MRRFALAGIGGCGYCRSHSRWFWGFRLYLLCSPDGLPVGFELAPANAPERVVAAEMLERVLEGGEIVIADKGFAGAEFECSYPVWPRDPARVLERGSCDESPLALEPSRGGGACGSSSGTRCNGGERHRNGHDDRGGRATFAHMASSSPLSRRGSLRRLSAMALTATRTLEPDMEIAAISGRSVSPHLAKTPAAIGSASEL